MNTTTEPNKKYKGLPDGGWIEYYSQLNAVRDGSRLQHIKIDYRVHYSVTGLILSRVSTKGNWEERRYDEKDRIVYYENNHMIKTFEYYIDELGIEQRNFNITRK